MIYEMTFEIRHIVLCSSLSSFLFQCAPSSLRQALHVDILGNVFEQMEHIGKEKSSTWSSSECINLFLLKSSTSMNP
ncbi:hypothetical protein Tco_0234043 [Tanacetum coccineum]